MNDGARQLEPGDLFAGYRIEGLVGRGGMGLVYKARQALPDRTVAVKILSPELAGNSDFRARFEREASLAAQIEHPNVIPIYAVGDEDGQLYIAMRFIESTDLGHYLARHDRLEARDAARFISQVAAALDAAHARGLVHRDVKPANVLVAGTDHNEHLYLTDFGVTKQLSDVGPGPTATGGFVGTLNYIAPEQVTGGQVDARADVYALGCVLYQLLTGAVPFPLEHDAAKIYAHLSTPPPLPSLVIPDLASGLDAVVMRAMAKNPADRFQSATELAHEATQAASTVPEPSAATTTVAFAPPRADAPIGGVTNQAGGNIYTGTSINVHGTFNG